ncbi:MAG: hypothetical protein R2752_12380 [Vicinamibacterales bacterium]
MNGRTRARDGRAHGRERRVIVVMAAIAVMAAGTAAVRAGRVAQPHSVLVAVTDSEGHPVAGLGPADFVVEAGPLPGRVATARPATDAPAVVIVADHLRGPESLQAYRAALRRVVAQLRERHPDARIGLMTGSQEGAAAPPLFNATADAAAIDEQIERYYGTTATAPLVEAILVAARTLRSASNARRLVIAVSNDWIASGVPPRRVADVLRETGSQLWALELWPTPRNDVSDEEAVLREVTEMSGGRRVTMIGLNAGLAVDRLMTAVLSQYVVTYELPGQAQGLGPEEPLRVGVRRDGVQVSASGWVNGPAGAP